jgi:hypothetical protein
MYSRQVINAVKNSKSACGCFATVAQRRERQAHGFHYQDDVIRRLKLKEFSHYTAEYDAECQGTPVQIKCMKNGTGVQLGDYRRNKNKTGDFIMIVGFWEQSMTNIIREEIRFVQSEIYTSNMRFIHSENNVEAQMYIELRSISNCYEDDGKWAMFRDKYKRLWCKENMIDLRFARDHKSQKRIQCGISWTNFNGWFVEDFESISIA